MNDPAEARQQPRAALAQQAPRQLAPVVLDLGGERYRVLEHQGRGAYAPAQGRFAVLDVGRDPLARDLLNQYAYRIQGDFPDVARQVWQTLFDTDLTFQAHMQAIGGREHNA